jgi:hypothetical protein
VTGREQRRSPEAALTTHTKVCLAASETRGFTFHNPVRVWAPLRKGPVKNWCEYGHNPYSWWVLPLDLLQAVLYTNEFYLPFVRLSYYRDSLCIFLSQTLDTNVARFTWFSATLYSIWLLRFFTNISKVGFTVVLISKYAVLGRVNTILTLLKHTRGINVCVFCVSSRNRAKGGTLGRSYFQRREPYNASSRLLVWECHAE